MNNLEKKLKKDLKRLKELGIPLDKWVDIEDEVYHSDIGISASGLKAISKCPAYYKYRAENPQDEDEKSEVLTVGGAIHTYILEPSKLLDKYIIAPGSDKRKKEWKDFIANMTDEEQRKIVLRKSDGDMMKGLVDSLSTPVNKDGLNIYENIIHHPKTTREKAIFTVDKERGILLKMKADVNFDGVFFDLKSTKSAEPTSFMRDAGNLGYGIQGSFYLKVAAMAGKKSRGFGFIAIEKNEPFLTSTIVMQERDITLGNWQVEHYLDIYTECLKSGVWYGYNGLNKNKEQPLMIPAGFPNYHRYNVEEKSGFTI